MEKKNNISKQLEFLNIFVQLFGINGLKDIHTEVKSSELHRFNEMTIYIPRIQELFKTSVMNLGRSSYKFNETNAIKILKHLLIQANVPFDVTKYSTHYTFALAPINNQLMVYHSNNEKAVIFKEKAEINLEQNLNRTYPVYDDHDIPFTSQDYDVHPNIIADILCSKQSILQGPDSDMKQLVQNYIDADKITDMFTTLGTSTKSSVRATNITIMCVDRTYYKFNNTSTKYFYIPFNRLFDVINSIQITLYNEYGNKIISDCPPDIQLSNNLNLISVYDIDTANKTRLNIDLPIYLLPYQVTGLFVSFEGVVPHYYQLRSEITLLSHNRRQMKKSVPYLSYVIKDGIIQMPNTRSPSQSEIHTKNKRMSLDLMRCYDVLKITTINNRPFEIYKNDEKMLNTSTITQFDRLELVTTETEITYKMIL